MGIVKVTHVRNGEIIGTHHSSNTMTTLGKFASARGMVSGGYAAIDPAGWMAIGIGSNTITVADTTLGSEYLRFGGGSVIGSTTTTNETNDTAWWIGSFGIDATYTVNEAGIFNASGLDLGSMFARYCGFSYAVISGDQVNIDWQITGSQAA